MTTILTATILMTPKHPSHVITGTLIDPKRPYDMNKDHQSEGAEGTKLSFKAKVAAMKKTELLSLLQNQNDAYFPSGDSTKLTACTFSTPTYTDRSVYMYAEGSTSPSLLKYKRENHKLPACYPEVYEGAAGIAILAAEVGGQPEVQADKEK